MLSDQQINNATPDTIEVQINTAPDDDLTVDVITARGPDGDLGELFRARSYDLRSAERGTTAHLLERGYAPIEPWRTTGHPDDTVVARRRYTRTDRDATESVLGLSEYYLDMVQALSTLGDMADVEEPAMTAEALRTYNDLTDTDSACRSLGAKVHEAATWLLELAEALGNLGRWVEGDDGVTRWFPDDE